MNSNIYSVVERGSNQLLSQPLLSRKLARVYKKMFKSKGIDALILKTPLDTSTVIR